MNVSLTPLAQDRVRWSGQVLYTTVRLFLRNELPSHAAAVSFYFLLSIVPIMLLVLYGLSWLGDAPHVGPRLMYFASILTQEIGLGELEKAGLLPRTRGAAGWISLLAMLWASRRLFESAQSGFRVIFADTGRRGMLGTAAISLLVLPFVFALLLALVLGQVLLESLASLADIEIARALLLTYGTRLVAFAVLWAMIFAAYYRLPAKRPSARAARICAALAAVTLLLLKNAFGAFFSVETYQAQYGGVGTVIFVLFGVYLAALVFLFWAQCLYAVGKIDVIALEQLVSVGSGSSRAEHALFGNPQRVLRRYGVGHAPGAEIVREGDRSDSTYFILSGTVGLYRERDGGRVRIGQLGEGDFFGEMAYLLGEPRTATVVAESEVRLLAVPPPVLEELMGYSARLSRRIIASLCGRLDRMNRHASTGRFDAGTG